MYAGQERLIYLVFSLFNEFENLKIFEIWIFKKKSNYSNFILSFVLIESIENENKLKAENFNYWSRISTF